MNSKDIEIYIEKKEKIKQEIKKYLKIYYDIETQITSENANFSFKDRIIVYPFFDIFEISGDIGGYFKTYLNFKDGYGDNYNFTIEIPFDGFDNTEILKEFKEKIQINYEEKNK